MNNEFYICSTLNVQIFFKVPTWFWNSSIVLKVYLFNISGDREGCILELDQNNKVIVPQNLAYI